MYYLCSENKGADQLRSYCAADLSLCFCICKKSRFSYDVAHLILSYVSEFPDSIANSSLADFPNTLFNTRHRHKSRSRRDSQHSSCSNSDIGQSFDVEFDETFSSALHRNNLVSSGTNPYADAFVEGYYGSELSSICMTTPNHVINYVNSPYIHGTPMQNIVPENLKYSYASVAQSKPSQKSSPFVSMTTKSDNPTCDKNVNKNKVKHNSNLNLNNVNVNVACIIKDLESAQERERQEAKTYAQKLYTWADGKDEKFKSALPGQKPPSESVKISKGQSTNSKSNANLTTKVDTSKPYSERNDLENGQSEGHDLSEGEGQNEQTEGQTEPQTGKKKRRRKRRRKRKNAGGGEGQEDPNSGANEDVNLCFEDEEEFPDLSVAMGDQTKSSPGASVVSYRDILKNVSI